MTRKQEAAEQSRRKVSSATTPKKQEAEEEYEDDDELSDQCPEPNGYFPDAEQCDKYYDCRDNKITEKLCPDGLVFNDFSPQHEKCDLPFGIDCLKRHKLRKRAVPLFIYHAMIREIDQVFREHYLKNFNIMYEFFLIHKFQKFIW